MLAMYYITNLEFFGETKIISYSNKFINNRMYGCKYIDQEEINKMEPNIKNEIPLEFLEFFENELL